MTVLIKLIKILKKKVKSTQYTKYIYNLVASEATFVNNNFKRNLLPQILAQTRFR